jgi:hypothetical protein
MNNFQILSRQELTRLACDTLAAEGKKPSIGLVREWTIAHAGAKKGSDGDVQKDIASWFDDLLKLKRDKAVADLPDAVGALARDLWRLAVDSANNNLAAAREDMQRQIDAAVQAAVVADMKVVDANERVKGVQHLLAIADETIAGRDTTIRRLEETLSEVRATLRAREERIAGLSADLARKAEEHAAGVAELDGLRKHSLLQIDQARGETRHWKAEFERVDAESKSTVQMYRQKASTLENDLSAVRGRLGAVEESLTASQIRCRELENELAVTNARQLVTLAGGMESKRLGAGKLRAARAVAVRKRKL